MNCSNYTGFPQNLFAIIKNFLQK